MVMLLREVERTGSLQKAAKNMNMAYSKAWKMLKGAEKEWGFALTDREAGGKRRRRFQADTTGKRTDRGICGI